jgi:hypothetical protein
MSYSRLIFIILIITLNLHNPSLNGSDCNTKLNSLGYIHLAGTSCYKSVIIKYIN